ncbi:Mitochondrial GTPase [Tyrophagus putrescentiae]|nr:Mitochondrial GTPase [Tyrophagus putrescentiae]
MQSIRQSFVPRAKFVINQKLQWFPGHMRKGLLAIHGRNLNLIGRIAAVKPVILLLNKSDLIRSEDKTQIADKLFQKMDSKNVPVKDIFFMDSLSGDARRGGYDDRLLTTILNSIEKHSNIDTNRALFMEDIKYCLLVMGIPNVVTGPKAGVTKAVLEKIKICDNPRPIYLFDTPGILEPSFHRLNSDADREALMKCALCGNIADNVVGPELIADYLLFWLNKHNNHLYVDFFGMPGPSNEIAEVLTYGAIRFDALKQTRSFETGEKTVVPNMHEMAEKFIRAFRKGEFGACFLDREHLESRW